MQQAIPYSNGRTWVPLDRPSPPAAAISTALNVGGGGGADDVLAVVRENPVVVLGSKGCCMCHVVRRLLLGLGVNPVVFEVDDGAAAAVGEALMKELEKEEEEAQLQLPAVFIGGELCRGLERLMAAHICGDLVPALKDAGALWL